MNLEVNTDNIQALRNEVAPKLKELASDVESKDVQRLENDDKYVGFFLEWNKTIKDAGNMVVKSLKWRKSYGVNELTKESLDERLKKGLIFVLGRATDGTRVLHVRTGKFVKKEREENMKLLVYWFERIQRAEPGEKITIVMDITGTGMTQTDMGFCQFIIECCASYFPAIMKRIVIYNLPTLLVAFWKLVSKLMSQEQRDATQVVSKKPELAKIIDKENLPVEMGGNIKFQYEYPPFQDDIKDN